VFEDEEGKRIAFEGSMNDSYNAFYENYQSQPAENRPHIPSEYHPSTTDQNHESLHRDVLLQSGNLSRKNSGV